MRVVVVVVAGEGEPVELGDSSNFLIELAGSQQALDRPQHSDHAPAAGVRHSEQGR